MKLYSAKVRLGGSIFNEVPVGPVTAAEIEILRIIHGGDETVLGVASAGEDKSTSHEVRKLLSEKYGKQLHSRKKTFEQVFGARTVPLPEEPFGLEATTAPAAKARRVKAETATEAEALSSIETPVVAASSVVTTDLIQQQLAEEFE